MPGSTRSAARSARARAPVLAEEDGDNPDNNADNSTLPKPTWDTADHTLPQFLTDLIKWLTKKDRRYARLVRNGTVAMRASAGPPTLRPSTNKTTCHVSLRAPRPLRFCSTRCGVHLVGLHGAAAAPALTPTAARR